MPSSPTPTRIARGTANGSCGAVEACEEPVSCGVDLQAAIADELSPNGRVVPFEQFAPTAVPEFGSNGCGTYDVGEEAQFAAVSMSSSS